MVQLSHLYMTPGKTIALTIQTFVGKVMSSLLGIYCHFLFFSLSYLFFFFLSSSVQLSSVAQLCPTLCDPMNRSMPGLPVHHQLPESTQTHAHWVSDAIQPSHPRSSPSPPAPNPSQHQVYISGMLFSYKKEENPTVWYNMNRLWWHDAMWNVRLRITNTLWYHLYMES